MTVVTTRMSLDEFDSVAQQLQGRYVTRVGVLGNGDARPDGEALGNAEIGLTQEFGSISQNIPPRSFLRMPILFNKAKIFRFLVTPRAKALLEQGKIKEIYKIVGVIAEGIVAEAFATRGFGRWAANSPVTIALKGSSAPLIDTGELMKSISSVVVRPSK